MEKILKSSDASYCVVRERFIVGMRCQAIVIKCFGSLIPTAVPGYEVNRLKEDILYCSNGDTLFLTFVHTH